MINPHIALNLKRARRIFAKQGRYHLVDACCATLGAMADTTEPHEAECEAAHLIGLANGDPIHA